MDAFQSYIDTGGPRQAEAEEFHKLVKREKKRAEKRKKAEEDRKKLWDLEELLITTAQGSVPLRELATYTIERGTVNINHLDKIKHLNKIKNKCKNLHLLKI